MKFVRNSFLLSLILLVAGVTSADVKPDGAFVLDVAHMSGDENIEVAVMEIDGREMFMCRPAPGCTISAVAYEGDAFYQAEKDINNRVVAVSTPSGMSLEVVIVATPSKLFHFVKKNGNYVLVDKKDLPDAASSGKKRSGTTHFKSASK